MVQAVRNRMIPAIPRGIYITMERAAKTNKVMIVPLIAEAICDGALLKVCEKLLIVYDNALIPYLHYLSLNLLLLMFYILPSPPFSLSSP